MTPYSLDVIDPAMSCEGCGKCCEGQAGLPVTYHHSFGFPPDFPADLRREVEETFQRWLAGGDWHGPFDDAPCVWYDADTKRCQHYEWRPDVCSEFAVGGEGCLFVRELRAELATATTLSKLKKKGVVLQASKGVWQLKGE
jgi:Fe-S-cluster containining protein